MPYHGTENLAIPFQMALPFVLTGWLVCSQHRASISNGLPFTLTSWLTYSCAEVRPMRTLNLVGCRQHWYTHAPLPPPHEALTTKAPTEPISPHPRRHPRHIMMDMHFPCGSKHHYISRLIVLSHHQP